MRRKKGHKITREERIIRTPDFLLSTIVHLLSTPDRAEEGPRDHVRRVEIIAKSHRREEIAQEVRKRLKMAYFFSF